MTELQKTGYWWDPANPDSQWPGTLSFDREEGGHLVVTVSARPSELFGHGNEYDVLHGETASGERISLIRCFDRATRGSFRGLATREIFANRIIVGFHALQVDPWIESAEAVLRNLNVWFGPSNFSFRIDDEYPNLDLHYRGPRRVVLFDDRDLTIKIYATLESIPMSPDDNGRIELKEEVRLQISSQRPRRLSEFQEILRALQDWFSIACMAFCDQQSLSVVSANESRSQASLQPHGTVHGVPIFRSTSDRVQHPRDLLFSYSDVGETVQDKIGRWISRRDMLRPIRGLYLSALYGNNFLDARLVYLAQAVEAFHRHFRGGTYVSEDHFSKHVLPALMSGIPDNLDPDFERAIRDKLRFANEYSLRRRLKELFREHGQTLEAFIPNAPNVVDTIVRYRNWFTHHSDPNIGSEQDVDKLLLCVRILSVVIELSFISEMGFSDEEISRIARRSDTNRMRFQRWNSAIE